jgi:hypothetical protein
MNDGPVVEFRSDIALLWPVFAKLSLGAAVLLPVLAMLGQWRAGRFPIYRDLILIGLFPFGALIFFGLLAELAGLLYPVKISQRGLRCYDMGGRYHTIEWNRIGSVYEKRIYGMPYLLIEGDGLRQPLALPLWLKDMAGFRRETERLAGNSHALVRALDNAKR